MPNSAKIHQKYAKLCKKMRRFAYKTLVLLKKKVKIDVSTYESVVNGCIWKYAEWLLSVFMHFYEGLDAF